MSLVSRVIISLLGQVTNNSLLNNIIARGSVSSPHQTNIISTVISQSFSPSNKKSETPVELFLVAFFWRKDILKEILNDDMNLKMFYLEFFVLSIMMLVCHCQLGWDEKVKDEVKDLIKPAIIHNFSSLNCNLKSLLPMMDGRPEESVAGGHVWEYLKILLILPQSATDLGVSDLSSIPEL